MAIIIGIVIGTYMPRELVQILVTCQKGYPRIATEGSSWKDKVGIFYNCGQVSNIGFPTKVSFNHWKRVSYRKSKGRNLKQHNLVYPAPLTGKEKNRCGAGSFARLVGISQRRFWEIRAAVLRLCCPAFSYSLSKKQCPKSGAIRPSIWIIPCSIMAYSIMHSRACTEAIQLDAYFV